MMDTVKIPGKKTNDSESDPLEYMIFVWNGKETGALLKVKIENFGNLGK